MSDRLFALRNTPLLFTIRVMRSIWRTLTPSLQRDMLAMAGAIAVIGMSFGAIAVAGGLDWWMPSAMSVLVFAGGSQFMLVGVVAAGGGLVAAVVGALLLNARHLPFGLAVGGLVGDRWPVRLLGAHLLVDESVAFARTRPSGRRARAAPAPAAPPGRPRPGRGRPGRR